MELIQFSVFLILPIFIALYSLFGTKEVKVELLLLAYIFAHQSSGPSLPGFSLSFEKVMSIVLLLYMIFSNTNYFSKFKKLIPIITLFVIFLTWSSIINGVLLGFLRIMFDLLQIFVLPVFLYSFPKFSRVSIGRLAIAFYRIGILILVIQFFELYINEDFYHYTRLSEGFSNYIGSVSRNNLLRASSLFGQVSATAVFGLIGLIITRNKSIWNISILVFCLIIYFSGTRLGIGLALLFLIFNYFPKILPTNKVIYFFLIFILLLTYQNLNDILSLISSVTRSGSEIAFSDNSADSSLFQRDLQFDYAYELLFTENAYFGFGRQRALELIDNITVINTCDSRLILYLLYGGIPGLIIYFLMWNKLIWFNSFKKQSFYNDIRTQLTLVLFIFMAFSSISDYFFLITITLSTLYLEKHENSTSK
jgi:hypothetical protein